MNQLFLANKTILCFDPSLMFALVQQLSDLDKESWLLFESMARALATTATLALAIAIAIYTIRRSNLSMSD